LYGKSKNFGTIQIRVVCDGANNDLATKYAMKETYKAKNKG